MNPVQHHLREIAAARLTAVRPDLATRHDLATLEGLLAARADITTTGGEEAVLVAAVVHRFDLAQWIRSTCRFTLGLDPVQAEAWQRSFTRTIFLAGNPLHLQDRFSFAGIADDASAAWTPPAPAAATTSLRRLLRLFTGSARLPGRSEITVEIPTAPRPAIHSSAHRPSTHRPPAHRVLYLAAADCTVADALVHLNHVLAEGVLDGLIAPGDRLTVRFLPRLAGVLGELEQVRVVTDARFPDRLMAAAGLSTAGG
ncbi:DUF6182 family protein [Streptomyces hesseae]|uniref:DUF6182 family protein n=1 Tax=Streptomyces hesseae TaxID=3075519 RepID=A0ABU2SKP7_9ACTN|nr:DUF6182 family protein [Streptomyces sp. DSM 40473]MDT0449470.1 DUF6182 family protein [Streptomyces sp. DSM 40473]